MGILSALGAAVVASVGFLLVFPITYAASSSLGWGLLAGVAWVTGVIVFFNAKNNKKLKQQAAENGALDMYQAVHIEGLGIPENTLCSIYQYEDRLLIDTGSLKFEIKYKNLRAAVVKSEQELIEKSKSVVGRALIGTLIVPGLGTIVGGMSGIGSKKKHTATNFYLILNYEDSKGEMNAATFRNNMNTIRIQNFCNDINQASAKFKPEVIEL